MATAVFEFVNDEPYAQYERLVVYSDVSITGLLRDGKWVSTGLSRDELASEAYKVLVHRDWNTKVDVNIALTIQSLLSEAEWALAALANL